MKMATRWSLPFLKGRRMENWPDVARYAYSKIAKVSITVTPAPPETEPSFESVKRSPDGQMHIVLKTQPGKAYQISVSTNLVDWLPFFSATADGAAISVTDTNAPDSNARFYRAVQH